MSLWGRSTAARIVDLAAIDGGWLSIDQLVAELSTRFGPVSRDTVAAAVRSLHRRGLVATRTTAHPLYPQRTLTHVAATTKEAAP